jgi:hypothetical protein
VPCPYNVTDPSAARLGGASLAPQLVTETWRQVCVADAVTHAPTLRPGADAFWPKQQLLMLQTP